MTTTIWEVLGERGLDVERLAGKGWSVEPGRDGGEVLSIPFVSKGVVAGEKFRRFAGEPKWTARWVEGPVAYNTDCLRDPALEGRPLLVTEGEMDCEAALAAGFEKVISVPNGCGGSSAGRSDAEIRDAKAYDWFRQIADLCRKDKVPEVILATDGDEAGNQLMHELALLFGKSRCKFLTYPKTRWPSRNRERCKDLNEVLQEYGQQGVVRTVERAQFIRVEGVFKMSELPPLPPMTIYDIGFKLLSENYKMRLGDFCVVTGVPGFGKTSFVNDLCCRVAKAHNIKVAWASFEQTPQRDHRRALRSWYLEMLPRKMTVEEKAEADRWIDEHHVFIMPSDDDDPTLDWLLTCMEGAVVQHGVKLLVIDPFNEIEEVREPGENETQYVGRCIRTFKRFAKVFQVHLIVVAHPSKLQKVNGKYQMPSLYEISGSAHWYNKADLGIVVHREDQESTIIKIQKSRYHDIIGRPGEVSMQFCIDDRRFRESERLA